MNKPSAIYKWILLRGTVLALVLSSSCMKDKPESLPSRLEWNPQLALPLGEEEFGLNSASGFDTLLLEEDTLTGQPFWLNLVEVVLEGQVEFDLSTISENLDKLNAILFRVNCTNQFPHTIYSQAYFHDVNGNPIDSMFMDGPAETPAAVVTEGGGHIDPGRAQHNALIEGERIPALADAQTILFRSSFFTQEVDSSLISYYPDFRFQIDSGLMLDLSFED